MVVQILAARALPRVGKDLYGGLIQQKTNPHSIRLVFPRLVRGSLPADKVDKFLPETTRKL